LAHRRRFLQSGDPADLDQAIEGFRAALAASRSDRASHANNLAVSLTDRFDVGGRLSDLAEAVEVAEVAVASAAEGSPDWAECAGTLVVSLWDRYDAVGSLADLDRAVVLGTRALAAWPAGVSGQARLSSNLAMLRLDRFERLGDVSDLEGAVDLAGAAVASADADDPELAGWFNNLGNALRTRFAAQFGDHESPLPEDSVRLDDLDEAIGVYRRATGLPAPSVGSRATFLVNLGNALADRSAMHRLEGHPERAAPAMDEAIGALGEAVSVTPPTAPNLASRLNALGVAQRFRADETGASGDIAEARQTLRRACERGLEIAPEITVGAADNWIRWAVERSAWGEVREADEYLELAADMLQRAQSLRRHQQTWLIAARGLAQEAAYASVQAGHTADAVARLERGRAVLLADVLDLVPAAIQHLPADLRTRYLAAADRLRSARERAEREAPR